MNENAFKTLNFNLLGKNCKYEGNISLTGESILNSYIKGTITIEDDSPITIERDALIEGNIYCKDIEVFGTVNGAIYSNGLLSIRSSAQVFGNVHAQRISIYPGATLNIEGHTDETSEKK